MSSKGTTNTKGAARPFLGSDKKGSNSQVSMMTSSVVCYRCNQTGHKVQDCPNNKGNKGNKGNNGNKGNKGRTGKVRGCFHCGLDDHIASLCPTSATAFPSLASVKEEDTQMKKEDTQMKKEEDTQMKKDEEEENGGWTTVTNPNQRQRPRPRKVKQTATAAAAATATAATAATATAATAATATAATGSWASKASKAASKPQPQQQAKAKHQKGSSDVDVCQPCSFRDKLHAPKDGGKTQLCSKDTLKNFLAGNGCPYEGRCRFAHSRESQDPTKDSAWFNGVLCEDTELANISLLQTSKWGRINWEWFKRRMIFCPKFIKCCNKFDEKEPITEDDICTGGINCKNGICGNTPDMDPRDGWLLDEQFVMTGVPSGKGICTPGIVPFDVQNAPKVPKAKEQEPVHTYQGDAFHPPVDWSTMEDNSAWDDPVPKVPDIRQKAKVALLDSWDDENEEDNSAWDDSDPVPFHKVPVVMSDKKTATKSSVQFVLNDEDLDWLEED